MHRLPPSDKPLNMTQGISSQGKSTEDAFLSLVPGSIKSAVAAEGDAVVQVDGSGQAVEIKKCDGGTINQVRAIKFIPLVVYNSKEDQWYVVPATELVRIASTRKRGQHTEVAFESMAVSLGRLKRWKCSAHNIATVIEAVARADRKQVELHKAMKTLLEDLKALASARRSAVQAMF